MYIHIYIYGQAAWLAVDAIFSSVQPRQPRQLLCFIAICRARLHDSFGTCFSVHLQCSEDCWQSWLPVKT